MNETDETTVLTDVSSQGRSGALAFMKRLFSSTGKVSCEGHRLVASVSSGNATSSGQKTAKEQQKDDPQKKKRFIEAVVQSTSSSETPAEVKGSRAARKPISYPSAVESRGAGKGEVSAAMGLAHKPAKSAEREKTSGAQEETPKPGHVELKQGKDAVSGTGGGAFTVSRTRYPNGSPQSASTGLPGGRLEGISRRCKAVGDAAASHLRLGRKAR